MTLAHLIFQIKAAILCYIVGGYYSFKQLFWKADKSVKRLPTYFDKDFSKIQKPLALITGGSKGIGFEVAKLLTEQKFAVIIVARNSQDGDMAVKALKKFDPECSAKFHSVDISDGVELKKFLKNILAKHEKLHLLINNAAVMMMPYTPISYTDHEMQWATNLVALVRITGVLLPLIEKAANEDGLGRIINLSSSAQFSNQFDVDYFSTPMTADKYSSHVAYANSKLAISLYTKYLQQEFYKRCSKVATFSLHPGVISTQLYQYTSFFNRQFFSFPLIKNFLRSSQDAAWDILYLCFTNQFELFGNFYFENNVGTKSARVDEETTDKFFDYCRRVTCDFNILWEHESVFYG